VPADNEMPKHWRLAALGTLLRRITYGFTNPMPTSDVGPLMLTANDIGDGVIRAGTARRTTQAAFDGLLTDKSRPKHGDILLTKDGTLGRVALFKGGNACVNQSVAVLTPNRDLVLPELLAELLAVAAYRDALVFEAGGTTIKHLYISKVVKQKVALPPLGEQPALAAALRSARSSHSKAAEAIEASIRLLREHRQALITAAVTSELEIPGVQ
jgi:type I restriction enzyme, S subunit